jgi:tetratricopeptide (TPR) repeat protein
VYFHQQKFAEAAEAARNGIDANPSFSNAHAILAAALMRLGRVDDAKAAFRDVFELQPGFTIGGFMRLANFEPAMSRNLADAWRELNVPE